MSARSKQIACLIAVLVIANLYKWSQSGHPESRVDGGVYEGDIAGVNTDLVPDWLEGFVLDKSDGSERAGFIDVFEQHLEHASPAVKDSKKPIEKKVRQNAVLGVKEENKGLGIKVVALSTSNGSGSALIDVSGEQKVVFPGDMLNDRYLVKSISGARVHLLLLEEKNKDE